MAYQTRSAVLFVVFNRPHTTRRVFEQIRAARPPRLYISADGARDGKPDEAEACQQVRQISTAVDWPCEVKTFFRDSNAGCRDAVSSGISWFFEHEEEGIVLEDDCLPAESFFSYCDEMLEKYRFDTRIRHVGGANLQNGKVWGTGSYYFSNLTHVWGWAGWRRVWAGYDKDLKLYRQPEVRNRLGNIFTDEFVLDSWEVIFKDVKAGKINTWDYQLTFINFFNNGLSVIPNKNLISNIGYGNGSTHTGNAGDKFANLPQQSIEAIIHPTYVLPEKDADMDTLRYEFNIDERYRRHNLPRRKFKRWLKSWFK